MGATWERARIGPFPMSQLLLRSGFGDVAGFCGDDFGGGLVLLRRVGRSSAATGGLLEPVAVAVHGQDVDVKGQPVEYRAGEPLRPQDRRPVFKGQV